MDKQRRGRMKKLSYEQVRENTLKRFNENYTEGQVELGFCDKIEFNETLNALILGLVDSINESIGLTCRQCGEGCECLYGEKELCHSCFANLYPDRWRKINS